MRRDIDREMKRRKIQAVVVYGDTTLQNPDLTYVVGGTLPRGGLYLKKSGEKPLLITGSLDLGLAKKYGVVRRIDTYSDWGTDALFKKYGRNRAFARLIANVLKKYGATGRITLCGRNDVTAGVQLADQLRRLHVKAVGENSPTILEEARATKEKDEINQIRRIALGTTRVVETVTQALARLKRKRGSLYLGKEKATVARVKRMISMRIASEDLVAPEGTIFATGPSSAEGHNMGIPRDQIKEGKLIVFDIFPQAESGYWFDFTRTYVVGRASRKARAIYETVREAHQASMDFIRAGVTGAEAMSKACEVVERQGYRTMREVYEGKTKSVPTGFNHSLGHGVGLTIGESPYLSFYDKSRLKSAHVVTVEPGVYFPGYGGVRIEDTVVVTERGVRKLASVDEQFELS